MQGAWHLNVDTLMDALKMQAWCKDQMMKLSKKDDLTLVEFLMSCQSSGETAEYISAYLGKSPEVASFTAEFIRRKAAQLGGGRSVSLDPIQCYCHASGAISVSL